MTRVKLAGILHRGIVPEVVVARARCLARRRSVISMVADPETIHTPSNCARLSCASAPETPQTRSAGPVFSSLLSRLTLWCGALDDGLVGSHSTNCPSQWLAETPRSRNRQDALLRKHRGPEIREVIQTPARAGGDRRHTTDAQQLKRYFATDERVAVGPFDEPLLHSSVALGDLERDLRVRVSKMSGYISDAAGERRRLRAVEVH